MDDDLDQRIRREVAEWPPLTDEQRDALAVLLGGSSVVEVERAA